MTKAELILKVAKNVGVPATDAKIFFELMLKRISAAISIGQSIHVNEFGYFHLIKGNIKKRTYGFKDSEISEEIIELILFSEDKELRKSDTKGLVFNIPVFDEDDYHPIDSTFSLSIGKPLIPLRGVPFDNIYIPTSGYEYRRLIESKVEKIIAESHIAKSEENFPTLVIDASSYNTNQVKLQWDDSSESDSIITGINEQVFTDDNQIEVSDSEKQRNELKNIAWDFGEDLSRQIEAESILDIADERLNMNLNLNESKKGTEEVVPKNKIKEGMHDFTGETSQYASSEKLNELLESDNESSELFEEEIFPQSNLENETEITDQIEDKSIKTENDLVDKELEVREDVSIEEEISDEEFWQTTSKYFEPFKPGKEENSDLNEIIKNDKIFENMNSDQDTQKFSLEPKDKKTVSKTIITDSVTDNVTPGDKYKFTENAFNKIKANENRKSDDQSEIRTKTYHRHKERNLIPFIVFPLIVIGLSLALYWYLEFYKKNEVRPVTHQIVLKTENARIIQRNFDIPVTYPYLPKVNETTISETVIPDVKDQKITEDKNENINTVNTKPEVKPPVKEVPKQKSTENNITKPGDVPVGRALNVGNNIYKYGNYYVVQVAAFRSSSISENEAGKYRNKGYNAFVEAAEIPDRGKWYRVRVGNFSSKEEAQNFVSKNIR
ncbi:MAG TPA: hypothetical protein DHV28_18375 [Ignavibacteriales bacterium]|nr:hypothetical protein [Ignavibacteriales bacterium]